MRVATKKYRKCSRLGVRVRLAVSDPASPRARFHALVRSNDLTIFHALVSAVAAGTSSTASIPMLVPIERGWRDA